MFFQPASEFLPLMEKVCAVQRVDEDDEAINYCTKALNTVLCLKVFFVTFIVEI